MTKRLGGENRIELAPRIADALSEGRPVVALESTIITHGMPYPQNIETARAVEASVREGGAEPATIALVSGKVLVGVEGDDLERLAQLGQAAAKASRRDLAALIVKGASGGTTVATTMQIAARCGIAIFATGGIGGVHRGAETSFDISADLVELGKTPVAVVCAGAKSILDVPKTLEVLETEGVPVLGFQTPHFPAFFARESGLPVDYQIDSVSALADTIATHWKLGALGTLGRPGEGPVVQTSGGLVIANPVPEDDALDREEIEAFIAQAIGEANAQGVSRKALTPFLLTRLFELTDGRTLTANIALVKNNAVLAGRIAAALASRAEALPEKGDE